MDTLQKGDILGEIGLIQKLPRWVSPCWKHTIEHARHLYRRILGKYVLQAWQSHIFLICGGDCFGYTATEIYFEGLYDSWRNATAKDTRLCVRIRTVSCVTKGGCSEGARAVRLGRPIRSKTFKEMQKNQT